MKVRLTGRRKIALAIVSVIAATVAWPMKSPPWEGQADIDAITATLFESMATHPQRDYHGVDVDGNDPNPVVLASLKSIPSIVPASRIGNHGSFYDKRTLKLADIFSMEGSSLRWHGPLIVTVEAQAHGSIMDGYVGTYTLIKLGRSWRVVHYQDSGIMF